jgi:heme/copper-type cytochrome/quinol oxidase subunit 3
MVLDKVEETVEEQLEIISADLSEEQEIHLPTPSYGPIVLAVGVMLLLIGVVYHLLLPVGLMVVVSGIWMLANFTEVDMQPHWLQHLNDRKLGMWIFLSSEVLFFTGLIGAYMNFKIRDGFEEAHDILSLPLATAGTSVLIISSFAVVMALEAIQAGDRKIFRNWMLITLGLGVTFLSIQAFEWFELFREDITAKTLFGTAFFVTTGFHGMHVAGGVGWLAMLMVKTARGDYSSDNYLGVELFGLYWHFVDIVWIVLFTIIYLIH